MEPVYMNENRYSYLVGTHRRPSSASYQPESPETSFERDVQELFLEGQAHLHHEEYQLALHAFRELQAVILHTANPKMPVDPNRLPGLGLPIDVALVDVLTRQAAEILKATPVVGVRFPANLVSDQPILPGPILERLKPALEGGLQVTSHHAVVTERLDAATAAIDQEGWDLAIKHYTAALEKTPATDTVLRASLTHDLAVLSEKNNRKDQAEQFEAG